MTPRPTGHRILVLPDEQPDASIGGIVLPQDHDHVPVSGTVVALGPGGSQMRYAARQRAVHDCCEVLESQIQRFGAMAALTLLRDEIAGLIGTSCPEREIQVGDRVAYPDDAGLKLTEDGQVYILLNEDDVAVVITEEAAA